MPTYAITFTTQERKRKLSRTIKLQAIGETHARQRFIAYAKSKLRKFARIVFIKEEE